MVVVAHRAVVVVAVVFAAFQLSFDPAGDANAHTLAAKSYLALRNEYRRLIADASGLNASDLRARRDSLARQLDHLDRTAPSTSPQAYERARQALGGTEELTFTDAEYGRLLEG